VIEHEFSISADVVDMKTKKKTKLVIVYGPAHDDKKEQFLTELSTICAQMIYLCSWEETLIFSDSLMKKTRPSIQIDSDI
jgi:hypothetical protein